MFCVASVRRAASSGASDSSSEMNGLVGCHASGDACGASAGASAVPFGVIVACSPGVVPTALQLPVSNLVGSFWVLLMIVLLQRKD